jgi:molybdopterin synthase catalytic subunit
MTVRITRDAFDIGAETRRMTAGRVDVGAVVTFTGVCRGLDDGQRLAALTLETYVEMAEEEIGRHVDEARRRWPLTGCLVVHRHGRILPGEDIVLVVTASAHRRAAFEAADFLMDYLKTSAPFWKSEERADGARAWVAAKESDDLAAARWAGAAP